LGPEGVSTYKLPFTAFAEVVIHKHPSAMLKDSFLTSECSVKKQEQKPSQHTCKTA